jgi:hypothetical protein
MGCQHQLSSYNVPLIMSLSAPHSILYPCCLPRPILPGAHRKEIILSFLPFSLCTYTVYSLSPAPPPPIALHISKHSSSSTLYSISSPDSSTPLYLVLLSLSDFVCSPSVTYHPLSPVLSDSTVSSQVHLSLSHLSVIPYITSSLCL